MAKSYYEHNAKLPLLEHIDVVEFIADVPPIEVEPVAVDAYVVDESAELSATEWARFKKIMAGLE
jgi:hypothetical protein